MRRADRLFQLVQLIRGRRRTTAAFLASRLEVSERTVYRDVADLQLQGVPIEGEAGVGYRLGRGFELPPLMFSQEEAQALVASVRMAQAWQDPVLAQTAQVALGKILSILPPSARAAAESLTLFAPPARLEPLVQAALHTLRKAAGRHQRVHLTYRDATGAASERRVRPLGCFFWGQVWTLAAWCESRHDFRSFRLDRIDAIAILPDSTFRDEPGKTLSDFLRRVAPPGTQDRLTGGG